MYSHKSIHYIAVAFIFTVLSCKKEIETKNSSEQHSQGYSHIELTEDQMSVAGVRLGSLEKKEMSQSVATNGYFDVPPQNKAQVSSFKPGYVKSSTLLVGDEVKKGTVLTVLENSEYVKIQQQYMEVKGQLEYLELEYERKKILEQEKITSTRNLQRAQADYQSALARSKGLQKELQLMGVNLQQLEAGTYSTEMRIQAPISGTITKVNTAIGKYVLPEEILIEIVNTEHLHVELEVFEKDIMKIKTGQKIIMRIPSMTNEQYLGEVYLVGKTLETDTRTIHVHGHVPEESLFVPGMYVQADILIENRMVQAVPEQAVVSEGQDNYLFLETGEYQSRTRFEKIQIRTGINSNGWIEIVSGEDLPEQASIVLEGAYYLSSVDPGS